MSAIPSNYGPRLEPAAASDESIQRVHGVLLGQKPQPEPGGYTLAPLALLGFMSTLILFGCIFMVHNRGGFHPLILHGHIDPAAISNGPPPPLPLDQQILKGKALYALTCLQCHGPEGKGAPGLFPPIASSDIVAGNEERLIRILLHGLKDPIKLNGETQAYSNKMPSLLAAPHNYNDLKIAYVLTYVRQDFGNKAAPVTVDRVKEVHEQTKARAGEWTFAELPSTP